MVNLFFEQVKPDGKCLVNAILQQVVHHPHKYTAEMCMLQVRLQMLKHPHHYYKYIETELIDMGESYESCCYNVFHENVWGDDLIASVIGDMWNIAITIVTHICRNPFNLFHDKDTPDMVVVANGGSWMSESKCSTHFSASKSTDAHHRMPGSEIKNPNLNPIIFDSATKARDWSMKQFICDEQCETLEMLHSVTRTLKTLDDKITHSIRDADKLLDIKLLAEYQLESIGIAVEKIKEAGHLPPRQYARTNEKQAADAIEDRKRKLIEELEEIEKKKQKITEATEQSEGIDVQGTEDNETDISMMMSETEQKHLFKDTFVQQVSQQVFQQVSQQKTQQRQVPEIPQMIQQRQQVQEIPQTVVQHVSSGNQPYLQTGLQTLPLTFEEEQEQALK